MKFRRHLVALLASVEQEPAILHERSEKGDVPVPEAERGSTVLGVRKDSADKLAWPHYPILDRLQRYWASTLQKQGGYSQNRDGHIGLLANDASSNIGAKSLPLSRHDV